jgi:hypothetical protein
VNALHTRAFYIQEVEYIQCWMRRGTLPALEGPLSASRAAHGALRCRLGRGIRWLLKNVLHHLNRISSSSNPIKCSSYAIKEM